MRICHAFLRGWSVLSLLRMAAICLCAQITWASDQALVKPAAKPTPPSSAAPAKKAKAAPKPEPPAPKATPSSDVRRLQAWKDAELIASLGPGRMEVVGAGASMQPVYGENTILVINKIDFDDLRPGMNVAYSSSRGHQVVHQLIAKEGSSWRIQGHNNATADVDRVTRHNLIGVVYASIVYDKDP